MAARGPLPRPVPPCLQVELGRSRPLPTFSLPPDAAPCSKRLSARISLRLPCRDAVRTSQVLCACSDPLVRWEGALGWRLRRGALAVAEAATSRCPVRCLAAPPNGVRNPQSLDFPTAAKPSGWGPRPSLICPIVMYLCLDATKACASDDSQMSSAGVTSSAVAVSEPHHARSEILLWKLSRWPRPSISEMTATMRMHFVRVPQRATGGRAKQMALPPDTQHARHREESLMENSQAGDPAHFLKALENSDWATLVASWHQLIGNLFSSPQISLLLHAIPCLVVDRSTIHAVDGGVWKATHPKMDHAHRMRTLPCRCDVNVAVSTVHYAFAQMQPSTIWSIVWYIYLYWNLLMRSLSTAVSMEMSGVVFLHHPREILLAGEDSGKRNGPVIRRKQSRSREILILSLILRRTSPCRAISWAIRRIHPCKVAFHNFGLSQFEYLQNPGQHTVLKVRQDVLDSPVPRNSHKPFPGARILKSSAASPAHNMSSSYSSYAHASPPPRPPASHARFATAQRLSAARS